MKTVRVTISSDGNVKFETAGFTGASCRDAVKSLKDDLGGRVVSDENTTEAFQTEEADNHQDLSNG